MDGLVAEGWVGGGMGGWVGLQKLITYLDNRNGHKGGVRVGFIYIKDMYNNDVGRGYRFSSLVKQNKKAKICFVIHIAGEENLLFYIYAVIVKQIF